MSALIASVCLALVLAPSNRPVVCIDPGHPSEVSSGAAVQNGTTEVKIAWQVALKLKQELEQRGFHVVMTKSKQDQLVRNRDRAARANQCSAALMVRLHCDASTDNGFALYYPDRQGVKNGFRGPPDNIIRASRGAAQTIHRGMAGVIAKRLKDGGVRGDSRTRIGSQQGALTGSIFSKVPVVTIEMVVLSDPADAEFIKSANGQSLMARAIAAGIEQYLSPTVVHK